MFKQLFPILTTPDMTKALWFYRDLIGGQVTYRFPADGEPAYVSLQIGESELGIGRQDEPDTLVNNRITLWVYAADCDAATARLRDAGVPVLQVPADQEWGERMAMVEDPDGNRILVAAKSIG